MHNGIRIKALSYHGVGILNMLVENKGVHEPQEERAFSEILPLLPSNPVCLEMGAYWSFYSLWLKTARPDASCHLVEPEPTNMIAGEHNFAMNGFDATFTNAFIGSSKVCYPGETPVVTVDGYCAEKNISHLHMLHSDIQGFESEMLGGAHGLLDGRKVDYIFISTHSVDDHFDSIEELECVEGGPIKLTVEAMVAGDAIAIYHQGMEFGPQALGARSVLASPHDNDINLPSKSGWSEVSSCPLRPL